MDEGAIPSSSTNCTDPYSGLYMSRGKYIRTFEIREKNRLSMIGKLKGSGNPMFGKKRPDLSLRNKMNPTMLGKKRPDMAGNNMLINRPGVREKLLANLPRGSNHYLAINGHSEETKRKLSFSHGGTGIPHENNNYPSEFSSVLRRKIRCRDNYTCQCCGMTEEEHLIVYGKVLEVHHIDYNKNDCTETNLISLCKSCNLRANYNRSYWKEFYGA